MTLATLTILNVNVPKPGMLLAEIVWAYRSAVIDTPDEDLDASMVLFASPLLITLVSC